MSTKFVLYSSPTCLPGGFDGTVNVIMCTRFDQTVPGQMTGPDTCSGCFKYSIQYDSDDLPEGVNALATNDITGVVCEGCLTSWIKEQFENRVVSDVVAVTSVDFMGSTTGDTHDLTLSITNPSATRLLEGMLGYSFQVNIVSSTNYAAGGQGTLLADGVAIPDTTRKVYNQEGVNANTVRQGTAALQVPVSIAPGATVEYTFSFYIQNDTEPDDTLGLHYAQMNFYGALQGS